MAARTSALAHLLNTVPPAVLAQLIGMSAQSAERYSAALRTDYSRYVALRVGGPLNSREPTLDNGSTPSLAPTRHQVIASR